MKLIIAGGRDIIVAPAELDQLINHFGLQPTTIVCGMARGIDLSGKIWADERGIPVIPCEPDWDNLMAPGARIKVNSYGKKYNANAGHTRNRYMAKIGDCLLLIWDGRSPGSASMKVEMISAGKKLYEVVMPKQ